MYMKEQPALSDNHPFKAPGVMERLPASETLKQVKADIACPAGFSGEKLRSRAMVITGRSPLPVTALFHRAV